jgi:hypothetical protein
MIGSKSKNGNNEQNERECRQLFFVHIGNLLLDA